MKKLKLNKYKVTQLNNLKSVNGGDNGDGTETIGKNGKIGTILKDPKKGETGN